MSMSDTKYSINSIYKVLLVSSLLMMLPAAGCRETSFPAPRLPMSRGNQSIGDACTGKRQCLIFFVAPWCGACHKSVNFLTAINSELRNNPAVGFSIIVGRDREAAIRKMATLFPFPVGMDFNRQASPYFGSSVPSWIVIDDSRHITARGSGAYSSYDPGTVRYFLNNEAKISVQRKSAL